jgi:NAD(P)-dependent dehydrogenase (short-subunit alcohol dehydrogenase family)
MTETAGHFLDFAGRWVVVTGASSGLGRACAQELAANGARLVLVGRSADTLSQTRAALNGDGHELLVADLNDVPRLAPDLHALARRTGRLYGLCHAAGIVSTSPLAAAAPESLEAMMRVNVVAGLELARALTRRDVMTADGGSLVFLSSVYGLRGAAAQSGYSATKGAIAAAVRSMAVELARRRVRVNAVSPGLVRTPMTDQAMGLLSREQVAAIEQRHPLGPGTPGDVARAVVFLLAPSTAWITGIDLPVDGGYSAM